MVAQVASSHCVSNSILIYYPNTPIEHCTVIYLIFYSMIQLFYSAINSHKHKQIIKKLCYGRGFSFTISGIKYINQLLFPIKYYYFRIGDFTKQILYIKSSILTGKPNKMQQFIKILLSLILNEAQHVSRDTPSIIRSLKLHKQPLVLHNTVEGCWTSNNCTSDNLPQ